MRSRLISRKRRMVERGIDLTHGRPQPRDRPCGRQERRVGLGAPARALLRRAPSQVARSAALPRYEFMTAPTTHFSSRPDARGGSLAILLLYGDAAYARRPLGSPEPDDRAVAAGVP